MAIAVTARCYRERGIKCLQQPGKGKADAVFSAYDVARRDVLMILDADLTMPPDSNCRNSVRPFAPEKASS